MKAILQIAVVVTLALHVPFLGSQSPSKDSEPVSVAFCDLVRAPEDYHGKVIRTRAVLSTGPENMELYVPECSKEENSTWLDWKSYEQAHTSATSKVRRGPEEISEP